MHKENEGHGLPRKEFIRPVLAISVKLLKSLLENTLLNMKHEFITIYMICTGILYGMGEKTLYKLFRSIYTDEFGGV